MPGDGVVYPPAAAGFYLSEAREPGRGGLSFSRCFGFAGRGAAEQRDAALLAETHCAGGGSGVRAVAIPANPGEAAKRHLVITGPLPRVSSASAGGAWLSGRAAHTVTEDSVAFNIQPRQTGQLLLGSSRQYGSEDREVDADVLRQMIERAKEYMPGLQNLSVLRAWTGFRAATADKLPLIGPAAGLSDDAFVVAGCGFRGGTRDHECAGRGAASGRRDAWARAGDRCRTVPACKDAGAGKAVACLEFVSVTINGVKNRVARGTSVAAAMLLAAQPNRGFRCRASGGQRSAAWESASSAAPW